MPREPAVTRDPLSLLAIFLPAVLAFGQAGYFFVFDKIELGLGFPIDDAYIFLRYVESLKTGAGFSFNPGETSFGCTSMLWPLLMAGTSKLFFFVDYVTLSFFVGGNLFAYSAALAAWTVIVRSRKPVLGLLAGLLIAGSPPLLMNSISGMETPLTMALLVTFAAIALSERPWPLAAGTVAGLLALCRPEGFYFPLGAVVAWLALRAFGDSRLNVRVLAKFLVPWALLVTPAYSFIYAHTGSLLPTTYLGKIMSANPGTLERGVLDRTFLALLSLGDGWDRLAVPLSWLAVVAGVGIVVEIMFTLMRARKGSKPSWPLWGRLILAGFLLLPMAYGWFFPVGPAFGGYYNRYVAPLLCVAAILGALGLGSLYEVAAVLAPAVSRTSKLWVPVAAMVAVAFLGNQWSYQIKDAKSVFRHEVTLNTGLRMDAAKWLASEDNTPPDARVLVGYTGLGVVGGNCERYVLDLGALINPDVFSYYEEATLDPERRWAKMVEYMRDRGLTYYVTFALTRDYAELIADPASTPGFAEVARLGTVSQFPRTPYEQIRVYHVNWHKWTKPIFEKAGGKARALIKPEGKDSRD